MGTQQQYSAAVTQPSSHYTLHPIGSAPGSSGAGMPEKRSDNLATGPVNKSFDFMHNAVSTRSFYVGGECAEREK